MFWSITVDASKPFGKIARWTVRRLPPCRALRHGL